METITIWEGRRGAKNGCDDSDVQVVEFAGQQLGYLRTSDDLWDNRGTDYRIYQTHEGLIVIHRTDWSRWAGENTLGSFVVYGNLGEAVKAGWRTVLEKANVIPRRVRSLREWRAEQERQRKPMEQHT